jgi:polysaccharide pyruvyl transferase WcaK-like protein
METVYPEFDVDLLTYTDEQLQEYIRKKQQEKDEEERRLKEDEEKREKQRDFQMYQRLKEKLGL